MITRAKIIDTAEELGWSCEIEKIKETNPRAGAPYKYYEVRFSEFTTRNQDVNVELQVESLDDLAGELYQYWQNYDVDEETALWIGPDGHGQNGAPYHITDILKDMEEVEQDLEDLYKEINRRY